MVVKQGFVFGITAKSDCLYYTPKTEKKMKINPKKIAYYAIIFIPFVAVFPFACIGWAFKWITDRYIDFAEWLQSKILNDL